MDGDGIIPGDAVRFDPDAALETWEEMPAHTLVAGRPVQFRFQLRRGRLFAFWVSPDASGASRGFVAAGGPEFMGPQDLPSPIRAR